MLGSEPAMPQNGSIADRTSWSKNSYDFGGVGLTKREYFAAKVMQGLLTGTVTQDFTGWGLRDYATEAVAAADELLKALEE